MKALQKIKNASSLWLIVLLTGYYILVKYTEISLPCPFRALTGWLCPGCGITTMFLALADGNVAAAKQANIFLFYTLPILAFLLLLQACWHNVKLKRLLNKLILPAYLASLIIFSILRNL